MSRSTGDDYVERVRAALGPHPSSAEREALEDLRALIDEMTDDAGPTVTGVASGSNAADDRGLAPGAPDPVTAQLGDPRTYAARLRDALADPEFAADRPRRAQARVLGVPVETRGITDDRVVARAWDPANPNLLVPRLFGGGWRLNLGAVAVRLGLLRPDDYDEEAVAHIPARVRTAARAVPVVMSLATCAAVAASWRRLPDRVATSWSVTGRVQRRGGRSTLLVLAALGAGPAAWSLMPTEPDEALVRSGIATSMTTLSALSVAATLADARREVGERGAGAWFTPAVIAAPVAGLADIVLPVRAGVRRLWRQSMEEALS